MALQIRDPALPDPSKRRRKKGKPRPSGPAHAGKPRGQKPAARESEPRKRSSSDVNVRRIAGTDCFELVHPRCARQRAEDIEEVQKMLAAGEFEIATDELRWLLDGCSEFIAAHKLLGELAMLEEDVKLARGHFGYAYRIGRKALPAAGLRGTLPYELPANRDFYEAGKGLCWCLRELGKTEMAQEVVTDLLQLDPSDPLQLGELEAELKRTPPRDVREQG